MRILRFSPAFVLSGCLVLSFLLWLPALRQPIVSDTAIYAQLGTSLWETGTYTLHGMPYAKHLPMHAALSYPLVRLLGPQAGMHVSTLLAGWGVIILAYALIRRTLGAVPALIAVVAVTVHHGFVLMTMLGSADLLFTCFFLAALLSMVRADEDPRWYGAAGIAIGGSILTRYNGLPLLLLFPFAGMLRPEDVRSPWYWAGGLIAGILGASWFLRNALVFGDPFRTEYTRELAAEAPNLLMEFVQNVAYYANPLHNVLPVLFLAAVWGLWRVGRRHPLLIAGMLLVSVLTAIWWVRAMRFAFPAFVILMGFSGYGIQDAWNRLPRWRVGIATLVAVGTLAMHVLALCLYAYGACNSLFDRVIGGIPRDLGLSSEGFHTWMQARDALDRLAPPGAIVATDAVNAAVWQAGVFRPDIRVVEESRAECPYYRITQRPRSTEAVLFFTQDAPHTAVTLQRCLE